MTRTSIKLRFAAALLMGAALAGCSSDEGSGDGPSKEDPPDGEIAFLYSTLYSAFDGTHTYQVPALLDQALFDPNAADSIDPEKVDWDVDSSFATVEPFADYPGSVVLTTKKAGTTTITATATTRGGRRLRGTAQLKITAASADEWQMGEERYNNNVTFNLMNISSMVPMGMPGMGMGGFPMIDLRSIIPANTSCAMCHNNMGGSALALTVEHTPLQTGGYSDEDLIQIFTQGQKPMGAKFNSPILNMFPEQFATMIYTTLHTWEIPPEVERGIVYKLRSITPKKQEEIDINRLRMAFANRPMGMGAAPAGDGAAGSAAPAP